MEKVGGSNRIGGIPVIQGVEMGTWYILELGKERRSGMILTTSPSRVPAGQGRYWHQITWVLPWPNSVTLNFGLLYDSIFSVLISNSDIQGSLCGGKAGHTKTNYEDQRKYRDSRKTNWNPRRIFEPQTNLYIHKTDIRKSILSRKQQQTNRKPPVQNIATKGGSQVNTRARMRTSEVLDSDRTSESVSAGR